MGCDIHGPEIWAIRSGSAHQIAVLRWDRDYTCFGTIAGVRDEDVLCEVYPRGFPDETWFGGAYEYEERFSGSPSGIHDDCDRFHQHSYDGGNCHSASWLATAEVALAQRHYIDAARGVPSEDLAMALMIMRTAESLGYEDVRLLFCFDS